MEFALCHEAHSIASGAFCSIERLVRIEHQRIRIGRCELLVGDTNTDRKVKRFPEDADLESFNRLAKSVSRDYGGSEV